MNVYWGGKGTTGKPALGRRARRAQTSIYYLLQRNIILTNSPDVRYNTYTFISYKNVEALLP